MVPILGVEPPIKGSKDNLRGTDIINGLIENMEKFCYTNLYHFSILLV